MDTSGPFAGLSKPNAICSSVYLPAEPAKVSPTFSIAIVSAGWPAIQPRAHPLCETTRPGAYRLPRAEQGVPRHS